ncbi:uncharacterized protein LOC121866410 [Homarus americanus]|nr:uncharacterized protein LOC121866410 [Homarus americanus]
MDVLECQVCFEKYNSVNRKPHSVTCGHSFCSVCLTDMMKNGLSSCPHCRKALNTSTLDTIPVNYSILSLVEAVERTSIDLSSLGVSEAPVRPPKEAAGVCDDHGNYLVFFCTTCDKWICRDCTVIEHEKTAHKVISIKAMLHEKKKENTTNLESMENQSKQQIGDLVDYLKELQTERSMLEKMKEQIKKAIELSLEEQDRVKQTLTEGEQLQCQLSAAKVYLSDATTLDEVNNAVTGTGSFKQCYEQWTCDSTSRLMSHNNRNNFLKWVMMMVSGSDVKEGVHGGRAIYLVQEVEGNTLAAPLTLHHGRLHLHALISKQPPEDAVILPYSRVRNLVDASSALTFLQLAWGSNTGNHVYIRMSGNTKRGQNFLLLCTGERGPSYSGSHLTLAHWLGRCGEYVEGGDYENDNGTGGAPLLDDLEYDGELKQPITCGVVSARSRSIKSASMFKIYTKDSPGYFDKGVFGSVEIGMNVMREVVMQKKITTVEVWDCGVVIPFES